MQELFLPLRESSYSGVPSTPLPVIKKRRRLVDAGVVKDQMFVKDYLFSSPSMAAAVIMGRSANGLIEWKKEDGSTMKDNQLQTVEDG